MELIKFNKQTYPKFQSEGNASQFAIPFAKHFCKGQGLDIGCGKLEWCFPGAIPVDPTLNQFDALNLPPGFWDYIYSSHCLEHLQDWVIVLNLWTIMLKPGGVLFLYLPVI